jgi:hypothetical protein
MCIFSIQVVAGITSFCQKCYVTRDVSFAKKNKKRKFLSNFFQYNLSRTTLKFIPNIPQFVRFCAEKDKKPRDVLITEK